MNLNKSNRISKGKRDRDIILVELLNNPLSFSQLQKRIIIDPESKKEISAKMLSYHLNKLQEEGLLNREIQGRYIVYVAVKPETKLQLRKEFLNRFVDLLRIYGSGLNQKNQDLVQPFLNSLSESIEHPEEEAKTTTFFHRSIKIDKDFESITIPVSKPYEKAQIKKRPKNKRKNQIKTPEPTSTKDPRFYGEQKKENGD